jgi:MoxR-like ATPase
MQERAVTAAGTTYKLEAPFFVLATQNPIEQEGTYPLPEAQLDRFMFNIWVDYPSYQEELAIVKSSTTDQVVELQTVLNAQQIIDYQALIRGNLSCKNTTKGSIGTTAHQRFYHLGCWPARFTELNYRC